MARTHLRFLSGTAAYEDECHAAAVGFREITPRTPVTFVASEPPNLAYSRLTVVLRERPPRLSTPT